MDLSPLAFWQWEDKKLSKIKLISPLLLPVCWLSLRLVINPGRKPLIKCSLKNWGKRERGCTFIALKIISWSKLKAGKYEKLQMKCLKLFMYLFSDHWFDGEKKINQDFDFFFQCKGIKKKKNVLISEILQGWKNIFYSILAELGLWLTSPCYCPWLLFVNKSHIHLLLRTA